MQHGVDVKEDVDCGDYLAKQDDSRWGLPKSYRRPPARRAGQGRASASLPGSQGSLVIESYIEYVQAMKGRRQLFWSNGLKKAGGR